MSFEDNEYSSINVVPVVDLSPSMLQSDERIARLTAGYQKRFNAAPLFVVRVPGRVNLIGEHIDYCGYSVFPMALKQDIMMAVGQGEKVPIVLANLDNQYPECSIELADIEFPKTIKWYHYFLCGYKGVVDKYCVDDPCPPINVMVDGTIPAGSGLSSSSAMVCSATLATLVSFYHSQSKLSTPIPKLDVAQLAIRCERYVGTDSGGMDQAIAILAEEGSAKIIDFIPQLQATNVKLPEGVCFYVTHCGVSMHKAASSHYNTRVAETKLAAAVIAKKLKIAGYKLGDQLWVVQQASAIPLAEMGDHLAEIFEADKEIYNKKEICAILGIQEEKLEKIFLSRIDEPIDEFKLYQRAKHVYDEAYRVHEFRRICETSMDVERLGQLMIESHESCRDLYECSHPKLDEFVSIALDAGAIGSRLTGAGWGGCTVSMVYEQNSQEFEAVLKKHSKFLCKSGPSGGAKVYKL